ncbi:unnamed protein product [Linum tenue]|uniref:Uncharacterized protein n=1 Tax=Linum tenue TaxID=586396 RepID=A0AAV0KNI3_9ROSI|nr:unnamed protein product [Linum tenue]
MQFLQSPVTGDQKPRPNSGRKPLQPKNSLPASEVVQISTKPLPKPDLGNVNVYVSSGGDKENRNQCPIYATPPARKKPLQQPPSIPPIDSSLAEELSAMRKRMERLRSDREKTEKMLKERDRVLDLQMKEMEARAEAQMMMEMEVDRLFRLKELHSYSTQRISPLRSLREKEQERKLSRGYDEEAMAEEDEGSSGLQHQQRGNDSPCCSSTSSNSISTQQQLVVAV